jgi:large subunit ribosomal protein L17
MRHHIIGYQLNRDTQSRRSLFKNLITSLVTEGTIQTTLTKAKAIQGQVDKLITKAKRHTLGDIRQIDKIVNRRTVVNRLVNDIAPATGKRLSGFTRIVKLNRRPGDDALMVRIEFVDVLPVKAEVVKIAKKPVSTKKAQPIKTKVPQIPSNIKDTAAPIIKASTAVKPGMIRQKSGER